MVCGSVLQCAAVCYILLQYVAVRCVTVCVAMRCSAWLQDLSCSARCVCRKCVAVHLSVLQCVATYDHTRESRCTLCVANGIVSCDPCMCVQ